MTTFETILPGQENHDQLGEILLGLIGEDYASFSPRELFAVETALDHGEVYICHITRQEDKLVVTSDLGSPDSTIKLNLPTFVSNRQAAMAMHAALLVLI